MVLAHLCRAGLVASLALASVAPALAERTDVLFRHKAWEVQGITFDDGSLACLAEVSDPGDSLTIWILQDASIRLQFYSSAWDFGEGDTADLEVEIDRRSPWSLTSANLYQNSILFDLPGSDGAADLVVEVARGNTLYLRSSDGTPVQSYSLAGSQASITRLLECGDAITSPSNPFQ